jgi:hypothetical protein
LVNDFEDSDEEPLKGATLEFDEIEPGEDEMIIAYIKGEPVIGIFEKKDTPLTKEHDYLKYDYVKNSLEIQQISTLIRSARYTLDKMCGSELKCQFLNNLHMIKMILIWRRGGLLMIFS